MEEKTILVTGATSGIGLEMARELAIKGNRIILACRNIQKAEKVKGEITSESKNQNVEIMRVDLSSLKSIDKFQKDFYKKYDKLHVLINNAGVFCDKRMHTAEGFEMTMGVNVIGTYYITKLLLKALQNAKGARIINVSSRAALFGRIALREKYFEKHSHGFRAYSASKLAQLLITIELSNALKKEDITVNAFHPGEVATDIWKGDSLLMKIIGPINMKRYDSPKKAAITGVYLATSDEVNNVTGKFFEKKDQVIEYNKRCLDEKTRLALIERLEETLILRI